MRGWGVGVGGDRADSGAGRWQQGSASHPAGPNLPKSPQARSASSVEASKASAPAISPALRSCCSPLRRAPSNPCPLHPYPPCPPLQPRAAPMKRTPELARLRGLRYAGGRQLPGRVQCSALQAGMPCLFIKRYRELQPEGATGRQSHLDVTLPSACQTLSSRPVFAILLHPWCSQPAAGGGRPAGPRTAHAVAPAQRSGVLAAGAAGGPGGGAGAARGAAG